MSDEPTKLTVNLIPRSVAALSVAAQVDETNRTDTVNRALQMWAFLMERKAEGARLLLESADGMLEELIWR